MAKDNFDVHKWNNQRKLAEANISEVKVNNPLSLVRSNFDYDGTFIYFTTQEGGKLLEKLLPMPTPSILSIYYKKVLPENPEYSNVVQEAKKALDVILLSPLKDNPNMTFRLSTIKKDSLSDGMVVVLDMDKENNDEEQNIIMETINNALSSYVNDVLEDIVNGDEAGDYDEYDEEYN
jgi:hypothetical protein